MTSFVRPLSIGVKIFKAAWSADLLTQVQGFWLRVSLFGVLGFQRLRHALRLRVKSNGSVLGFTVNRVEGRQDRVDDVFHSEHAAQSHSKGSNSAAGV